MKNTKKALVLILCLVVSFAILSCGSGGKPADTGPKDPVHGIWEFTANDDANDRGTSTIVMTVAEEVIDGETFTTYHFKGVVTNATQYGVVDATMTPDEETLDILKAARAISFKMLADGRNYVIEAPISTVTDWGFHRYTIKTEPGVVQEHMIDMRFFMQPAWASPVRFNRDRLTRIRIQTVNAAEGGMGPFEFKVWDVTLYP